MKPVAALVLIAATATACADDPSTGIGQDLLSCAFGGALAPDVGEVVAGSADASFCVEVSRGGEFALVPFLAASRDTALRVDVNLQGGGFAEPSAASLSESQVATSRILLTSGRASLTPSGAVWAFHRQLRERERAELNPRLHRIPRRIDLSAQTAARPRVQRQGLRSRVTQLQATSPEEGELVELNVAASCDVRDRVLRTARVVAVTQRAVVLEDVTNPGPGFTDADLRAFGESFDRIVYPLLTNTFGETTDLDGNGRVQIFFTRGVNQLTPNGGSGIVAGFFWAGDLFPRVVPNDPDAGCEGSNEAEIVYLAVPDPDGIDGPEVPLDLLREVTVSTIGHEMQHLINASRRIYVNGANEFEETWLDEGLSHVVEELLFYEVAGLDPGTNIDVDAVVASQDIINAFNRFALDNFARYNLYLEAPQDFSLIGVDALETRGAAWAFMRYALDRDPRPDPEVLRTLGNATTEGLQNLEQALGANPLEWMRDWTVSVYADDLVSGIDPQFDQPSWNFRDLLSALREDGRFPLDILSMPSGGGISLSLQPGAAAYPVFSLTEDGRAAIVVDPGEPAPDRDVETSLIRVR